MKTLALLGAIAFALSFCSFTNKLTEKLKGSSTTQNSRADSATSSAANSSTISNDEKVEKPRLSSEQMTITANGKETRWDDQGMSWTLPNNWRKMDQSRLTFNYASPNQAFLLVNISPMAQDFPAEISLKANYDGALTRLKNGSRKRPLSGN